MKKRKMIIILLIIILGIFVWQFFRIGDKVWYMQNSTSEKFIECGQDSDCVPSGCCHPSSCGPISKAPNCSEIICTQECKPGTLDCNQASCACVNNKCNMVLK